MFDPGSVILSSGESPWERATTEVTPSMYERKGTGQCSSQRFRIESILRDRMRILSDWRRCLFHCAAGLVEEHRAVECVPLDGFEAGVTNYLSRLLLSRSICACCLEYAACVVGAEAQTDLKDLQALCFEV